MFRYLVAITMLLTLTALSASTAWAADRGKKWELSLGMIGTSSESDSAVNGSSIDFDSAVGWSFGAGYNLTSKLSLGFTGSFVRPKYSATYNTDEDGLVTLDHKASIFNGHFNGTWHFMEGPFTPFVSAGLGWTHANSNVSRGPPVTGCWWDPWWGYVCRNYYSTYKDTQFSYSVGAGLRYDFENDWFVRGSINRLQLDGNGEGVEPKFDSWRLEVGWMVGGR